MQPDERVEAVFEDHHHIEAAQQLAQHDTLVDTLAAAERVARIADLFPIPEGGAAVVAPEFGAGIQRREVGERLGRPALAPIGGAAREILIDVKPERHRQLLLLDRGDV